ncbi:uncharacterized protein LOC133204545 [Saccostrea echinata]|uniref:uncharacterized protein LOC133204545 n=1 Tax=Saccostrea echinata TaxID=191078 RepID=UPI002A7FE932|nr:uncharacterized protein LOC133204545 [Saccostrea echinata]
MDDEDEERKMEEIRKWSSFVLDDVIDSNEKTKKKLHLLQKDLDAGFDLKEEKARAINLISYLHWRLGEREKAFEAIKKAQEVNESRSLITLCNEILFHQEVGEYCQFRKLSDNFETHLKEKGTQTRAVAEIAYFYSRFGPRHHDQAVQLFRKAIEDMKPNRNILWEFGLALTLQRQSHMFQMTDPEKFNPGDKKKESASMLYAIVKCTQSGCLLEYCQIIGKAWCRLGSILTKNENLFDIVNIDKTDTMKINQNLCFEKALQLCPNHYFVLQSYGQQLRYWWELEKSREMLEKAIHMQDMPFSRHHLAITLKKIVERDISKQKCRRNLNHSFSTEDRQQVSGREHYDSGISSMSNQLSLSMSHQSIENRQYNSAREQYDNGISSMTNQLSSLSISHPAVEKSSMYWKDHTSHRYQRSRPFVRRSAGTRRPEGNAQWDIGNAPRYQQRTNTPFFRSQSDPVHQTRAFNAMRKSPNSVCHSPGNPLLIKAVEHLEKALEMDKDFNVARYELGLIYRMLDKTKDAMNCFSFITSDNCGKPSEYKMTLINAFEQQGFCKLEMKSKETDPGKQEELQYDAEQSMWKAVSVMSGVIRAIPKIQTSNQCFPTLKSLLLERSESPKNLKELAKLHELLQFPVESIKFIKRLIEIGPYDKATVKKLIQNYIEIKDFENAICTLSLLQCTGDLDVFERSIYVDTYIKGAKDSMEKHDFEMGKIRLLKAYQTIFPNLSSSSSCLEDDAKSSDIFILHSCGESNGCQQLKLITSTLQSFVQLRVAVNSNDCLPFRPEMTYVKKAMSDCRCILVLFHETGSINNPDNMSDFVDLAIEMILRKYRTKTLVINTEGNEHDLQICKELILPTESCGNTEDSDVQTLKEGTLFSNILTKMSELF